MLEGFSARKEAKGKGGQTSLGTQDFQSRLTKCGRVGGGGTIAQRDRCHYGVKVGPASILVLSFFLSKYLHPLKIGYPLGYLHHQGAILGS